MDICLQVLKESNKSRFNSYSVRNNVLIISRLPFGIVACTFFLTAFLEIPVIILGTNSHGKETTTVTSHQCSPSASHGIHTTCGLSLPYSERFFTWYFGLPLSSKTNLSDECNSF